MTWRLSDVEIREKSEKGLCFKCDEKYSPEHRCKTREKRKLRLIIAGEGQVIEEISDDEKDTNTDEATEKVELALRLVLGFSTPGTMKLKGKVGGREVIVLIDCGATHNFIHRKLVEELNLSISKTTSYGIVIGDGTAVQGKGVCKQVIVELSEVMILENFLPLHLGQIDIILGMSWLRTMGYMGVD